MRQGMFSPFISIKTLTLFFFLYLCIKIKFFGVSEVPIKINWRVTPQLGFSAVCLKLYLFEIFMVQSFSYQGSFIVGLHLNLVFRSFVCLKLCLLWIFMVFLSYQGGFIGGLRLNPVFGLDLNLFDLSLVTSDST